MLYKPNRAQLDVDALPEDFRDLGAGLSFFAEMLKELREFERDMARGELSGPIPGKDNELAAPLKDLHASLKHLTWQTKQVARGDYSQHIEFMGEFADSFNEMITQLKERKIALENELTQVQRKTMELARSNSLFEAITSNMSEWIVMIDRETGEHLFANHPIKSDLYQDVFEQQLYDILLEYARDVDENSTGVSEEFPLISDTAVQYFSVMLYPIRWYDHDAVAAVLTDVTKEKEVFRQLEDVAYRDMLTGAYNRHFGMKLLSEWLKSGTRFVICFIDMDRLKYVNDVFGHNEGDNYILTVERLLERFNADPYICRLGGDEYMILAQGCTQEEAEARLEELREELIRAEYSNEDGSITYNRSFSYGVVEVTADNTLPSSDLLATADERMYEYKKAHKAERKN